MIVIDTNKFLALLEVYSLRVKLTKETIEKAAIPELKALLKIRLEYYEEIYEDLKKIVETKKPVTHDN
jgi:hypothetical protein